MLIGLKKPMTIGETVPLKLTIAKAGDISETVPARAMGASQNSQGNTAFAITIAVAPRQMGYPEGIAAIGGLLTLVDDNGAAVTEKTLAGRPYLNFGYTYCPEVCPTTLFDLLRCCLPSGPDPIAPISKATTTEIAVISPARTALRAGVELFRSGGSMAAIYAWIKAFHIIAVSPGWPECCICRACL